MSLLKREELLSRNKRRYKDVQLPGGGEWRIQSLSELEKADYENWVLNKKTNMASTDKLRVARQQLIVLCSVDDKGERVFGPADRGAIGEIDSAVTACLNDAIREWIGFDKGDIEDLVKNSEAATADDST